MISKSLAKIGIAAMLSSVTVIALLAGCGSTTTVTNTTTKVQTATATVTSTAAGAGAATTVTATTTVAGSGTGTASTVTATATKTVTTTASGGGTSGGTVMSNLVVYGDIVSSTVGCIDISAAHRGEVIVPRATVIDPKTGNPMDNTLITSVVVTFADTTLGPVNLKYGTHGTAPYTQGFWAGSITVPLTEPLGVMPYTVTATANDGRTGTWSPFNVATSLLNIVQYNPAFVAATIKISATGTFPTAPTVTAGETVTFTNGDIVPHTIYIVTPGGGATTSVAIPASPATAAAGTNTYVFATAGAYVLHLDSATSATVLNLTVGAAPTS